MNILMIWAFSGLISLFPACNAPVESSGSTPTQVSGELSGCQADSIRMYTLDGIAFRKLEAYPLSQSNGNAAFSFKTNKINPGFYFLGTQPQDSRMVILGIDKKVTLAGQCGQLKQASLSESPVNAQYEEVNARLQALDQEFMKHITDYRRAMQSKQDLSPVVANMADLDRVKLAFLDSLKKANPFLAKVAGLQTYVSYQGYEAMDASNKGTYANEPDYFAESFFRYAELGDPLFNTYPLLHERFKAYTNTLGRIIQPASRQRTYVQQLLDQIPDGSSAEKIALLGAATGFEQANVENYVHFGEMYLAQFPNDDPSVTGPLLQGIGRVRSRVPGAEAPEISLPTPEGEVLKLSDLRGKVVLIDFWASWCGPCRRENPNVVKVYNQYKDKGFEILGVSLDKDKARWEAAIAQDGLTWLHVSDLKYWQSVAAKAYGVSSIPYTVLLDPEGRIIANKLRGPALEAKLAEIFD